MEQQLVLPKFHTNSAGKVRNTQLSRGKAMWPLYESISNAIHAIEEKGNLDSGEIIITLLRNGELTTLEEMKNVEISPVKSFIIEDNGIGFNERNFHSFLTAESEYKIDKGAKGIGRFVCLKAFRSIAFDSIYIECNAQRQRRYFSLKPSGFDEYILESSAENRTGTIVYLDTIRPEFQRGIPKSLKEIGHKIIEHFLIYFVLNKCPYIRILESNNSEILLQDLYGETIGTSHTEAEIIIEDRFSFKLHLIKLYENKGGHKIHYCANEREVFAENLVKYIPDLGKLIKDADGKEFTYQCYVTGNFLDINVDNERTDFHFPVGDNDDEIEVDNLEDLSLKQIRTKVIDTLEKLLESYLSEIRETKFFQYRDHISENAPQYKPLVKYKSDIIKMMPPNLSGNKLNIELFKIQNDLELEIKELGESILKVSDDIRSSQDYMKRYEEYIEKFNDIGKSNLARYIVHRKAVIELLDISLGADENGEFQTEETIHNIFFPIRKESDEISYEQQNLWLIDERLSYHYYLASDKVINQIPVLEGIESKDRLDLLIFNSSFAFVNDEAPHNSFVIVEFKRPERNHYSISTEKKNPVDQVISYIRIIRENGATDRRGKLIQLDKDKTPFYAYIVCDFNQSLTKILEDRDYKRTPDNLGFFNFHEKYNAYIEVISYQKMLKDAKSRNRVLFEKLGLPH
ncbi:MAG: ATP-binding protein [Chitinophaga sp.]|uniref:ATP-binding protein n=1 Tax=Chitinophaga sp. TaxID=1869181 RepID=UPI0025BF3045|nr:ATP-binding protein [Chitinophaga sp.]MBV8252832.1 ATP-binding protein [Chitinophaga sp.]